MNSNDIKQQLAKLRRDKRLLWLAILFFVMVIFWILANIFATSKTSSISPELRELAKPFVPRLESKAFDEIMGKRSFSSEELSSFSIYIFDKKNVDGVSPMIDIIAPSPEPEAELPVQVLVASESAGQAKETVGQTDSSENQSTEAAILSTEENNGVSSPTNN